MITPGYAVTATERVLPRLALDFTTGVLDPRVTVTRALNTATRVNSSGYIESINADLPRFDYDPITLVSLGCLIEETRTNTFPYSEQFTATGWVPTAASFSTDSTLSPANTLTADKLIEDSASSNHAVGRTITTTINLTYTLSVFVKSDGRRYFTMGMGAANSVVAAFDLQTGVISGAAAARGAGWSSPSATIKAYANGFYRCSITGTDTVGTSRTFSFSLSDVGTAPTSGIGNTYTGNGTSGAYLWGAQLETGAFPTSYIPTTTTSLTRNADVVSMTGTNFSSWYTTAGNNESWFAQFISANMKTGDRIVAFDTGITGASAYRTPLGNAFGQLEIYDGTGDRLFGTIPLTGTNKAATGYSGSTVSGTLNGAAITSRAFDGNMNPSATLGIGSYSGTASGFINGWMQKIAYYPQRLTDRELQAITK